MLLFGCSGDTQATADSSGETGMGERGTTMAASEGDASSSDGETSKGGDGGSGDDVETTSGTEPSTTAESTTDAGTSGGTQGGTSSGSTSTGGTTLGDGTGSSSDGSSSGESSSEDSSSEDSSSGESTSGGSGPSECRAECELGPPTCMGSAVVQCELDSGDCPVLRFVESCGGGEICESGSCRTIDPPDEWERMDAPASADLLDVWAPADDTVWAAGYAGTVMRFDGVSWLSLDSSAAERINCIDGASPEQVYAMDEEGTLVRYDPLTGFVAVGSAIRLWSTCVTVTEDEEVVVSGRYQGSDSVRMYTWSPDEGFEFLATNPSLFPVSQSASRPTHPQLHAHALDDIVLSGAGISRWDGRELIRTDAPAGLYAGLWTPDSSTVFAARIQDASGVRTTGSGWSTVNPGFADRIHGFAGNDATLVVAVGEADGLGVAAVFRAGGWSAIELPEDTPPLFAADMSPSGMVYAVGEDGVVIRGVP